jgi:hypothetical protein
MYRNPVSGVGNGREIDMSTDTVASASLAPVARFTLIG